MDYRVASNIRGKSLSSLITDKITSGGSVGSSIRGAISDKLKARGTGIKEKFDPMNIARAMTGGGKLAPAILGRITGRSQADINYFAGNKKKFSSYTKMPSIDQVPSEGIGGSAIGVLNKMLTFMQKNRENDLKRKKISMSFEEEKQSEEQRRHEKFLKVLKDYTGVKTAAVVQEKSGGMFDGIMEILKGMFDKFMEPFKWLWDNKDTLLKILGWATGPIGLALLGAGAIVWLAGQLKDYFRENVANMKVLSPKEAQALLENGTPNEIASYPGGREALVNIVKNGAENAQKTLNDYKSGKISKTELNNLGGEEKLNEMIQQKGLVVPEKQDLPATVQPRPKKRGYGQIQWDNLYGARYNPDGKLKIQEPTVTPAPTTPATTPASAATPVPATTTPVPTTPASSVVVGKIQENNDLNMQSTLTAGSHSTPSVSVSSSSTRSPDQTVTSTATTRDDTPILDLVLKRAKAQV